MSGLPYDNIKKAAFAVSVCPITRGLRTRMLEATFRRFCSGHRSDGVVFCTNICRGNIPGEVEFIENIKEEQMANQWIKGKCECCGAEKMVRQSLGKMSCANCEPVWRFVAKRSDMVVDLLKEKMGLSWLVERVGLSFSEDHGVNAEEVVALREELRLAEEVIRGLRADIERCKEEAGDGGLENALLIEKELVLVREEVEYQRSKVGELEAERIAARRKIEELMERNESLAERNENQRKSLEALQVNEDGSLRESIVLDIALRVISGEVSGLAVEDLEALR